MKRFTLQAPVSVMAGLLVVAGLLAVGSRGAWSANATPLPVSVEQTIRKTFPNAQIGSIEYERRVVRLIEVTLIEDGQECDLAISEDGTILSITHEIDPDDLPQAARGALQEIVGEAKIEEAEKVKIFGELLVAPLASPRIVYEAEFREGGRECKAVVSGDGVAISTPRKVKFTDED